MKVGFMVLQKIQLGVNILWIFTLKLEGFIEHERFSLIKIASKTPHNKINNSNFWGEIDLWS